MSVFQQQRPARVRIENETTNVDVIVPAFLAFYPDPATNGEKIALNLSHQTPAQLAAFIEAAIRLGTALGVMQIVLANLTAGPQDMQLEARQPRTDIPPDDLPEHLRRRG